MSTLHRESLSTQNVDNQTARALDAYARSLKKAQIAPTIIGLILYGSGARGDHNSPPVFTRTGKLVESDLDVAVLLKGKRPSPNDVDRIEFKLFDFTVEALSVSEGLMIDPFAVWESDLEKTNDTFQPDLYLSIIREGIEWHESVLNSTS